MRRRYVLAPQAARDLAQIWRYVHDESSRREFKDAADRVESVIRSKFGHIAAFPDAGHWRRDQTPALVRFFPVYSCLIVYRPETKPLQIVAILRASCDLAAVLPTHL